jgi:hypothetical protein
VPRFASRLALTGALLIPTVALATSIVAVRTPRSFVIAADSKPTYRGAPGPPSVCKIYRAGKLYFAISGLDSDSDRGFFPAQIVAAKFSETRTFAHSVASVERAVSAALLDELNAMRATDPQTFRFTIRNRDVTSILLAEFRAGVPRIAAREFQYVDSPAPGITVNRINCPGDCPAGNQYFFLGEQSEATQFVKNHRRETLDPRTVPESLVKLEARYHPDDVGPPVAVLRVDRRGPVWLAKGAGCPIVVSPPKSPR